MPIHRNWSRCLLLLCLLAAGLLAIGLKPAEETAQPDAYFETLQATLKSHHIDHPVVLIDLDRVDGNLAQVKHCLGDNFQFRATTKSLPSYELLAYVLRTMGSRKVMEFHGPFLRPLITHLGAPLDILLGKPLPVSAAEAYLSAPAEGQDSTVTIHWLIDTPERLSEYSALAQKRQTRLNLAIELDIGLHRGGLPNEAALHSFLASADKDLQHLRITGVLGYDGHVFRAPPILQSAEAAEQAAFVKAMADLNGFITPLRHSHPQLFRSDFVINSGGSRTYTRYCSTQSPSQPYAANELALGSAVLKPADFDVASLRNHQPAVFIAEPVLKRTSPARLPFADFLARLWRLWNSNRHDGIFVYSGGWTLHPVFPKGLHSHPLYNDRPTDNRIPNQSFLNCSKNHPIRPGDFVFYRPLESDTIMQFEKILVVRSGQLVDLWHPLPQRL